ncbi:TPA: hypothetical protein EYP44_03995 [Candidatus Bathyarchaeota archaeon]|nr:hypothetical protein [Candidatus Bathyarchaeota archaeon]
MAAGLHYQLLLAMHNLCIVREESAKTVDEIARHTGIEAQRTRSILRELVNSGYVGDFVGDDGRERFFLTRLGIIKVCSLFT